MSWSEQAATSHYQTAVAIQDCLRHGQVEEAAQGLEELIEALARAERRALKSQLIRLMKHVLKWQTQTDQRSRSWAASIRGARKEIRDIQAETPSLTDAVIRALWPECFERAKDEAEAEMNQAVTANGLAWEEVFVAEYRI